MESSLTAASMACMARSVSPLFSRKLTLAISQGKRKPRGMSVLPVPMAVQPSMDCIISPASMVLAPTER